MKFGERLDAALKHLGWGPSDLASRTSVAMPTISAITSRGSDRTNYKEDLIRGFPANKISHEWLRAEVGSMVPDTSAGPHQTVEATNMPAAAPHEAPSDAPGAPPDLVITEFDTGGGMDTTGRLLLDDQPGTIKSWRVTHEWLRLNVPTHTGIRNLCIVTGFGPSMRPMFNPGDPLLVDTGVKTVTHEGVYFFRVGDEGYIKMIQRVPDPHGDGVMLNIISKNPDYPPYPMSPKNPHFEVLGKVLTVWRSEQY